MKITIDASQFEQAALRTINKLDTESPRIIRESAEMLFQATQEQAPIKSGSLLSSGDIKDTSAEGILSSEVSYGEKDVFNTESRAWVSDYLYKVTEDNPKGNFFEQAFINNFERIADKINREVGGIISG